MGRRLLKIDKQKLEEYAQLGLSVRDIAHNLGLGPSTLYEKIKANPEYLDIVEKGRAKSLAACAMTLLDAGTSKFAKGPDGKMMRIKQGDPRWALEYMRMHGYAAQKIELEVSGMVENQITGEVVTRAVDQGTLARMARAYLQVRGAEPA